MHLWNTVTGRNEARVRLSTLQRDTDALLKALDLKADKDFIESIAAKVATKYDKERFRVFNEGFWGCQGILAEKSDDRDVCEAFSKGALNVDPVRYACCALTKTSGEDEGYTWASGNPLYDAIRDGKTATGGNTRTFVDTTIRPRNIFLTRLVHNDVEYICRHRSYYVTTWNLSLPLLETGWRMFKGDIRITTFNAQMMNLVDGESMFQGCTALVTGGATANQWKNMLPRLEKAVSMFQGCNKLPNFSADLPRLVDGRNMFNGCTKLATLATSLPELTSADGMFTGCILTLASVNNLAAALRDFTTHPDTAETPGTHRIDYSVGSGVDDSAARAVMEAKGWTVNPA